MNAPITELAELARELTFEAQTEHGNPEEILNAIDNDDAITLLKLIKQRRAAYAVEVSAYRMEKSA